MHTQSRTPGVTVPDYGSDEYVRFDANDRAAEQAAAFAFAACSDAGPCPSGPVVDVELGESPF